jgi:hypothetical protein
MESAAAAVAVLLSTAGAAVVSLTASAAGELSMSTASAAGVSPMASDSSSFAHSFLLQAVVVALALLVDLDMMNEDARGTSFLGLGRASDSLKLGIILGTYH